MWAVACGDYKRKKKKKSCSLWYCPILLIERTEIQILFLHFKKKIEIKKEEGTMCSLKTSSSLSIAMSLIVESSPVYRLRVCLDGRKEMWNDRKCCKDRKEGVLIENIYVFYHVCLVGRMEMWEDRNFFVFLYLVEKKNEKMKIVVYKNLLLHPQ